MWKNIEMKSVLQLKPGWCDNMASQVLLLKSQQARKQANPCLEELQHNLPQNWTFHMVLIGDPKKYTRVIVFWISWNS